MSQDEFTKLFQYMQKIDNKVDSIQDVLDTSMATKDDIRRLESLIDGYAAKIDDYSKEMAAMQHKIDRLERMIHYLADKANVSRDKLETI